MLDKLLKTHILTDPTTAKGKLIHWPPRRNVTNGTSGAPIVRSKNDDDTSLDSFQRKALNAIHALDEVVAKEQDLPTSYIDNYLDGSEVAQKPRRATDLGTTSEAKDTDKVTVLI